MLKNATEKWLFAGALVYFFGLILPFAWLTIGTWIMIPGVVIIFCLCMAGYCRKRSE